MPRRWLWLAPFALAFAPTVAWLVGRWTDGIYRNGHGIFVPFLIAYLALDHLKADRDPAPRASAFGFVFLGLAAALLVLDSAINTQLMAAFALVLALPGLSLVLLGGRRTRAIALPLSLGLFMLPIPSGAISQVFLVLRLITAVATTWLVPLFGIPIARDGTHLQIPGQLIEVADACSGFATLYAAILTAIILAHLGRSRARRVAVLAAAVPLALVCNFVRVTGLVLLVRYYGADILATRIHPASGMVLFVFVIGALVWIAGRDALHASPGSAQPPFSDRYAVALFVLFAVALLPVVVHSYLQVRSDDCANPQALVPAMAPGSVTPEREADIHRLIDVHQWRDGRVPAYAGSPELQFTVIRSYNPKQLYYRGTRHLWTDIEPGGDTLDWLEGDGVKLPIVRSRTAGDDRARGAAPVVAALLVYEGEPVESGWRAQLRAAPRQMLTGSRPMTLFAVRANPSSPEQRAAAEKRANQWLVDSWRTYRAICGE
jgi:exosortase